MSTYDWLSARDHVLTRPDTYVGPVTVTQIKGHVFTEQCAKTITCETSPVIFKLFDEVIVNAIDNQKRDATQTFIHAFVDKETGTFRVVNNGGTIPVKHWEGTQRYVPEILVYELMSGENFSNQREKVGGRNGLGLKLVNLLSDEFTVDIVNVEYKLKYRQEFKKNASVVKPPTVKPIAAKDKQSSTSFSWTPDYARIGVELPLSDDIVNLLKTRLYDAAACTSARVGIQFNKEKLSVKSMKDYALALGGSWIGREEVTVQTATQTPDSPQETVLEFCMTFVRKGEAEEPRCIGFVNGLQCSAGTHVELVYRRITEAVAELCKKKLKRSGATTSARLTSNIKDMLILVVNATLENPSFTSQTKEKCDLRVDKFHKSGFHYAAISQGLYKQLEKSPLLAEILTAVQAQEDREVQKSVQQTKKQKHSIPKYQRALKSQANLYITEGDSAMAMALSGFSVIGRDCNGVFPLRGKLVNVYGMKAKTALDHKEIMYLTQILQLEPNKVYDEHNTTNLPYRHIVVFTDQDHDGSHIMGLILTFLREYFPTLFGVWPNFVQRFATHIVKAKIGQETRSFFSIAEYKQWCGNRVPSHVKYYKGLGTSTDEEAREYFRNIAQHLTDVEYTGKDSEEAIRTFYAPDKSDKRKEILQSIDEESYVNYELPKTTFEDFCFHELIHHCAADNERSIASAIDGLKPSQRKILYTLRRRKAGEVKVAALAANTMELTAYHHGETSLVSAIMMMAQKHIGTNNIAYLKPNGQFGSRLTKRDAGLAAPRYVFTEAADICKLMFRPEDDGVLTYAEDDGMSIEPKFYVPVVASVLINGCEGIGTGYKTSIPNFDPMDVIAMTRRLLRHSKDSLDTLVPYFSGFKGTVVRDGNDYSFTGTYTIHGNKITITELPPKVWSTPYFEWLQKQSLDYVNSVEQKSTKEDVCIVLCCKSDASLQDKNLVEDLKLSCKFSLNQMNLFDHANRLVRYADTTEILREHATIRIETYRLRLASQIERARLDVQLYTNKARFVTEVTTGKLVVSNKKKDELRAALKKASYYEHDRFNYLIDMEIYSLTIDEVAKLVAHAKRMEAQLKELENTTPEQVWLRELDELETGYQEYVKQMTTERTHKETKSKSKKR